MKNRNRSFFAVVLFFLLMVGYRGASALDFKGDSVSYDMGTSETVCEGNVVVRDAGKELASDKAKVNVEKNKAHAEGNVLVMTDKDTFLVDKLDFDFQTGDGTGEGVAAYNYPWIITGEKVERKGEDIFITHAVMTPSTTPDSIVHIKAGSVVIEKKKFLIIKNMTYYIGKVPVFWFPYVKKNIADKKTEIKIMPGHDSSYGAYVKTAYRYWFTESLYGRAHLDYLEKKGTGLGADIGLEKGPADGLLSGYYINDEDYVPVRSLETVDGATERYGINMTGRHTFPSSWLLNFEANKQSDIDFYDNFFYDDFRDQIQKRNYISLNRSWDNMNLSLYMEKRLDDFFTVLEKEPQADLSYNNYALEDYDVFHRLSVNASRLNLRSAYDTSDDITVARFNVMNELSAPRKFFTWLNVKPTLTMENTYYDDTPVEDGIVRNVFTGDIDVFTKFYRAFYPGKSHLGYDRFRHVFEPHVTYTYRPEPNYSNSEIYQLDGIDNRPELNQFKLDLRNLVQAKKVDPSGAEETKDLLTGSFFIYYYMIENEFSNIGYNWNMRFLKNMSIDLLGTLSKDDLSLIENTVDLAYYMNDYLGVACGWVYREDSNSLVSPEVFLDLDKKVFLRGLVRYDYHAEETEYTEVSLVREYKGMNIGFQYRNRNLRDEETYMIVFSLTDYPKTSISLR
jgi:lipopolysaccharide assembly outer membrane protein LptD (OstA)